MAGAVVLAVGCLWLHKKDVHLADITVYAIPNLWPLLPCESRNRNRSFAHARPRAGFFERNLLAELLASVAFHTDSEQTLPGGRPRVPGPGHKQREVPD